MQYTFDVQEAIEYGVDEAIMIWNLRFWILKNKANNKHLYDGKTWTYNSHEAFQRLFPFWTKDQVRRILERLLTKKVIIKGNFNNNSYNKTAWYAFVDEAKFMSSSLILSHMANLPDRDGENAKSIWQNRKIDVAESENGIGENAKSNTDIKPNVKPNKKEIFKIPNDDELKNFWGGEKFYSDWKEFRDHFNSNGT